MTKNPDPIVPLAALARFVKLSDLRLEHKHWVNPRLKTGLDTESLGELGTDIKTRGIQVPLKVQKIKTPHDMPFDLVLDGQRRVLAAREVLEKDDLVPVIDVTSDPIEFTAEYADRLLLDMLAVGKQREGLSSFELSEAASRLRDRDRKLSDISKAIGKSESWISKMLKARQGATPSLMLQWRKGEITDEQFKDLAEVKDFHKQNEEAKAIVEARKSGDVAEARVRAKEIKETARAESKPKQDAAPPPAKPAQGEATYSEAEARAFRDAGGQIDRPAPKPKAPSRAVLDDMLYMADKRPPTADYVKGVMDGVRYACGLMQPDAFSKAWHQYVRRIEGQPAKAKGKAKAKQRPAVKNKGKAKAKSKKGKR
jgi:ParB/RepB/Spo0J family partition protein